MKISELIQVLEDAFDEHGDLPVCVHNSAGDIDNARAIEPGEDERPRGIRDILIITP